MSLGRVEITQEVLLTCLTHAMTTEAEEIMGLLLGDIKENATGHTVSRIWMAYPQIRTDRRKDRVETSPEQMARCSAHAERLSRETGVVTRVVGWYHSHPHITVLPSHVDVRTQAMYQMLDPGFVGLIFSVFNDDTNASKGGRVQVTAFQSVPPDSPLAAGAGGGASAQGAGGGPGAGSGSGSVGLEGFTSSELRGMDELTRQAIQASAAAAHNVAPGTLVRREVPLSIVPPSSYTERSLHDYVVVQRILAMEEREAFTRAMATSGKHNSAGSTSGGQSGQSSLQRPAPGSQQSEGSGDEGGDASVLAALARLHHSSCYQQGLSQLLEAVVAPALSGLRCLLHQQHLAQAQLRHQNQLLQEQVALRQRQQQQREQLGEVRQAATPSPVGRATSPADVGTIHLAQHQQAAQPQSSSGIGLRASSTSPEAHPVHTTGSQGSGPPPADIATSAMDLLQLVDEPGGQGQQPEQLLPAAWQEEVSHPHPAAASAARQPGHLPAAPGHVQAASLQTSQGAGEVLHGQGGGSPVRHGSQRTGSDSSSSPGPQ